MNTEPIAYLFFGIVLIAGIGLTVYAFFDDNAGGLILGVALLIAGCLGV